MDVSINLENKYSISSSSGAWVGTSSGSFEDVTNMSVTITCTGRPVRIWVLPEGSGNVSNFIAGNDGTVGFNAMQLQIIRDATVLGKIDVKQDNTGANPGFKFPPSFEVFDLPSVGSHTYKLQAARIDANALANVNYCRLAVMEL
jgi:hypothetical protein